MGIEQAVDMIDAESIDVTLGDELHDQAVRMFENIDRFHTHGGESVNVEKSPIIHFVGGGPPVTQAVGLFGKQGVE